MTYLFVGLDGEMTGTEVSQGHKLIQLGLSFGAAETRTYSIGWPSFGYQYQDKAMSVHGVTHEQIQAGVRAPLQDEDIARWIMEHGIPRDSRRLIPVGWNVAAFDLPFVKDALPQVASFLFRRTVDLNAVVFTLTNSDSAYKKLKKASKWHAEKVLGSPPNWHDAGYDAAASLLAWYYLRQEAGRDYLPGVFNDTET